MKDKAPMIEIAPPTPTGPDWNLRHALTELDKAIRQTDGGRKCDSVIWSALHAAKQSIEAALAKIEVKH